MVCFLYTPLYDWAQFRNLMRLRYKCLLQWEQNRSKATMWQLYELQLFEGAKTFLVDWRLCVACYYPTTPTDYPSTARGTPVGLPVAVYIDICGYLQLLSFTFLWIMWVQYATNNLSGQQLEFVSYASVDIWIHSEPQSKWYSKHAVLVSWKKCAVTKSLLIYRCLWRALGGGGGEWKLLNESLTFKGPAA
jgi:hypothetical protein